MVQKPRAELGKILREVEQFLRRFVHFKSPHQVVAMALWVAHTHAFQEADSTPYIYITSPEKQAGKSKLLEALGLVVARPWRAVETTEATLFRKIEKDQPTLLLDEVDAAFGKDAKLYQGHRAILNEGHRRGARVPRMGGAQRDRLDEFEVFCPKAFAGIGDKLPDTVRDRSIRIELSRKTKDEAVEKLRRRKVEPEAALIRERIAEIMQGIAPELVDAEPQIPEELSDRAADGWEPLLAIADAAGGTWPHEAREASVALSGSKSGGEDSSNGVRLLGDIRGIFEERLDERDEERDEQRLPTDILLRELVRIEESPWGAWWGHDVEKGHLGVASSKLARMLRVHGISPRKYRDGSETFRGYFRKDFTDAFNRYLPPIESEGPSPTIPPSGPEQRNIPGRGDLWDAEDAAAQSSSSRHVPSFQPTAGNGIGTQKNATGGSAFSEEQVRQSMKLLDEITGRGPATEVGR